MRQYIHKKLVCLGICELLHVKQFARFLLDNRPHSFTDLSNLQSYNNFHINRRGTWWFDCIETK
jgi:hypothetical protein